MQSPSSSPSPRTLEAAILGEFVCGNRLTSPAAAEWMAQRANGAAIVVANVGGAPSKLGVAKAVSIVQSQAYVERRARQLLRAFVDSREDWRLEAIDFGAQAARQACEFLMCFVLDAASTDGSRAHLHVEIGFTLDLPLADDPKFKLTVKTIGYGTTSLR